MAKGSRNSGFERQGAVMGQFRRDARSSNANCAVMQAIKAGKKNAEYRAKREAEQAAKPQFSPKFLHTGR
jgi:ATP:corrinoid adenosyltransferase